MRRRATSFGLLLGIVVTARSVPAADQPIDGTRLLLERSGTRGKLVFVSHDADLLFPAVGGPDDPATTAGLLIELFAGGPGAEQTAMDVPPGLENPGWAERAQAPAWYRYRNRSAPGGPSPVRLAIIRQGKLVKIIARQVGLQLAGPQGSVGIRISTGNSIQPGRIRNCALFDASTVRHDEAGRFEAAGARGDAISDCGDGTMRGIPCTTSGGPVCGGFCPAGSNCGTPEGSSCVCISASQPCGDTGPVCNGQCPTGETCGSVGGVPYPSCGCLPDGSTPCGTVYPTCGDGDCPSEQSCYGVSFTCCGGLTLNGCQCLSAPPPPPPCSQITCPPGFYCAVLPPPGGGPVCVPSEYCAGGGAYPACGGTCSPGRTCTPYAYSAEYGVCACVP
jgi:hypothetical protein